MSRLAIVGGRRDSEIFQEVNEVVDREFPRLYDEYYLSSLTGKVKTKMRKLRLRLRLF